MKNQEAYTNAKEHVEARMGFYTHLVIYLAINTFLAVLNITLSGDYFWAIWPAIGWGSGLLFHFLFTFVFTSESSLKERLIEKEMQKQAIQ